MAYLSTLRRVAPLAAAGVAAAWYLRRRAADPRADAGVSPPQAAGASPVPGAPASADPVRAAGEQLVEAHAESVEAVSDAADVTAVVEDLLAAAPEEEDGGPTQRHPA